MRSAPRRGFTLVEAAVVFAVLVVLSSLVLLRLAGSADPRNDAAAKASLQVFQEVQLQSARKGGVPLSASAVVSDPSTDTGSTTFVDDVSTGVTEVGVAVDPSAVSVVSGVVRSGDDCWMLRLDFDPSPISPPSWWFLLEGVAVCEADAFGVLAFPDDGSGQSPNSPTFVD